MKKENGITLIALIITIIVMLILVAVTINVALNGGLFSKASNATLQTEVRQIQEELTMKRAEMIAENYGAEPNYNITLSSLNISENLKEKYDSKLVIRNGTLYYREGIPENDKENFMKLGILEEPEDQSWHGITNITVGTLYTSYDETKKVRFNSDGSLYQYNVIENGDLTITSEEVEEYFSVENNKLILEIDGEQTIFEISENVIKYEIGIIEVDLRINWNSMNYGNVYYGYELQGDVGMYWKIAISQDKTKVLYVDAYQYEYSGTKYESETARMSNCVYDSTTNSISFQGYALTFSQDEKEMSGYVSAGDGIVEKTLYLTEETGNDLLQNDFKPTKMSNLELYNGNYYNAETSTYKYMRSGNGTYFKSYDNSFIGSAGTSELSVAGLSSEEGIELIDGNPKAYTKDGKTFTLVETFN